MLRAVALSVVMVHVSGHGAMTFPCVHPSCSDMISVCIHAAACDCAVAALSVVRSNFL